MYEMEKASCVNVRLVHLDLFVHPPPYRLGSRFKVQLYCHYTPAGLHKSKGHEAKRLNQAQQQWQFDVKVLHWPIKFVPSHIPCIYTVYLAIIKRYDDCPCDNFPELSNPNVSIINHCAVFRCLISLQTHRYVTQTDLPGSHFMVSPIPEACPQWCSPFCFPSEQWLCFKSRENDVLRLHFLVKLWNFCPCCVIHTTTNSQMGMTSIH